MMTPFVPDPVLDDFRFMKAAHARGEFRGLVRVERRADGSRRVVPVGAASGRVAPRTSAQRQRHLEQLSRGLAADRARRLAQAEHAVKTFTIPHASVETYRRRPVTYHELSVMNEAAFWPQSAR